MKDFPPGRLIILQSSVTKRSSIEKDSFWIFSTSVQPPRRQSLQVKLAELKYEIPRAREAVRLSLKGEQAGFMGMGEYAVDIKFRALKRQMVLIQKKLEEAHRRRQLFKSSRDKLKLPFVSLAGYTSSGKTTLFNGLVSESKEESAKLFTTLTTTTRGFEPFQEKRCCSLTRSDSSAGSPPTW